MKAIAYIVLFAAILFYSCTNQNSAANDQTQKTVVDSPAIEYPVCYEGVLPCADCPGIKTKFCISFNYGQFKLSEEYLERDSTKFITTGNLNTERGYENDENATVFILNHDKPESEQRIFVRKTGKDEVLPCDVNRKIIGTGKDFTLKKIK